MSNNAERIQIHEFDGKIALCINGEYTTYLSTDLVDQLQTELVLAKDQIENGYHFETAHISEATV